MTEQKLIGAIWVGRQASLKLSGREADARAFDYLIGVATGLTAANHPDAAKFADIVATEAVQSPARYLHELARGGEATRA
jgi:hypothetical protein